MGTDNNILETTNYGDWDYSYKILLKAVEDDGRARVSAGMDFG